MTSGELRRLVVLRHAKSAWPDGVADHERPLAPRGRRDAPAAGRWLREAGCVPDLVVCSTAGRTRQTWDLVSDELDATMPVTHDARLYRASAGGCSVSYGTSRPVYGRSCWSGTTPACRTWS